MAGLQPPPPTPSRRRSPRHTVSVVRPTSPRAAQRTAVRNRAQQQRQRATARAHAGLAAAAVGRRGCRRPPPWARPTLGRPPMAANVLRDAPLRRFARFERDPVGAREFGTQNLCSVAATSYTFFRRSDHWIGIFFAPSQSRFAGPTSSACTSSTAVPFGVLPVLV
ncbi:hypothetical protein M6B38_163820 [Iris pallida]|uniref:Uncharacterized protein n=1 Tax=Iris pallida TaxID=29817 RepID=A0AAX6EYZ6_IRIPA|nr:hypothetical protein M6B38_163820 [Iris pallida]